MQVVHTAVVPPSTGNAIFANIGSSQKSSAALTKRVSEKTASERVRGWEGATDWVIAIRSAGSGDWVRCNYAGQTIYRLHQDARLVPRRARALCRASSCKM